MAKDQKPLSTKHHRYTNGGKPAGSNSSRATFERTANQQRSFLQGILNGRKADRGQDR